MARPFACVAAALLVTTAPLEAQETASPASARQSIWLVYGGDHAIARRLGLVFDAQLRMTQNATRERQVLLRPGASFVVSPALKLSAGYTVTSARDDGTDPFFTRRPEHRAWMRSPRSARKPHQRPGSRAARAALAPDHQCHKTAPAAVPPGPKSAALPSPPSPRSSVPPIDPMHANNVWIRRKAFCAGSATNGGRSETVPRPHRPTT